MTELEQRIANARHEYAVYVDWQYEERKEEFDCLIAAVKAEALREAAVSCHSYLANEVSGHTSTYSVRKWLRARANELDPDA